MIKEQHTIQTPTTQRLEQLHRQLAVRWLTWTEKRGAGLPLPQQVARGQLGCSEAAKPPVANTAQFTDVNIHVAHRST